MPITVEWDDEAHTVIVLDFDGAWTWDEYEASRQEANVLLKQVSHPVAMIVDFHNSEYSPNDVLTHAHHALDTTPINLRHFVLVGANPFLRHVYGVMTRVYRVLVARYTVMFADSREDARLRLSELCPNDSD